ncbi:Ras guanyl-releasing protein 3 [Chamberlinius hualienensis]
MCCVNCDCHKLFRELRILVKETSSASFDSHNGHSPHHSSSSMDRRSVSLEEDKPIVPGVNIRAATMDSLVEICINCFNTENDKASDKNNFPYILYLMHKWFTSSDVLANMIIQQFSSRTCRCVPNHQPSCDAFKHKLKLCRSLRYWIHTFPVHFNMDTNLTSAVRDFQDHLKISKETQLIHLLDLTNVPSYDWMRNFSVRNPTKSCRKVSLVFNHLEADELAVHLTYLEHKAMRRITFRDFKVYAQSGILGDNPKLERSIALFNGLSQWVQCMVLSQTKPLQRAEVINKFVNVAKKLLELQNFNTLMAVVGGLSHSALARLSKTFACVPMETQKDLKVLSDLLSSMSNFGNYRKALNECKGFKIPILGVHMKDLITLQVALPDYLEGDVVNFRKMVQLSFIFRELNELQNSKLPIDVNMDLVNTLRLSLDLAYTEDDIYELSLAREPRNSSSPQCSPTKPAVFAEWAAGVSNVLEPETIEKHVQAMVDAVFKNYDHDHDDYISQSEFEAIAGNFPFIDSFAVLDADKDGMISKSEMKNYFIRANCYALRSGFKHDFHETTYFKPTFCAHCTGLLWGLIKQGYKCKDCCINAHKHCKDLVVMECRRLSSSSTPRCNSVPSADGVVLKNRIKHWRRQQKSSSVQSDCSDAPPTSPGPLKSNGHNHRLDSQSDYVFN